MLASASRSSRAAWSGDNAVLDRLLRRFPDHRDIAVVRAVALLERRPRIAVATRSALVFANGMQPPWNPQPCPRKRRRGTCSIRDRCRAAPAAAPTARRRLVAVLVDAWDVGRQDADDPRRDRVITPERSAASKPEPKSYRSTGFSRRSLNGSPGISGMPSAARVAGTRSPLASVG